MSNSLIQNLSWPALTFLFADRQSSALDELVQALRERGHECIVTDDCDAAEEHITRRRLDVVVLDTCLHGNQRLELATKARGSAEPPVVIVMTAEPTLETAIGGVKIKVDAYLVKPFSSEDLLYEVRSAFGERERAAARQSVSPFSEPPRSESQMRHGTEFEVPAHVRRLTRREYEVLQRVLVGDDVAAIGSVLFISPHTVRNHLKAIYRKLDVRSRVELVVRFASVKHEPAPQFLAG